MIFIPKLYMGHESPNVFLKAANSEIMTQLYLNYADKEIGNLAASG